MGSSKNEGETTRTADATREATSATSPPDDTPREPTVPGRSRGLRGRLRVEEAGPPSQTTSKGALAVTSMAALGVVFGDIGTSPLYAFAACFDPTHGVAPTRDNVLGVISCIFWALTFVVGFKYAYFILRADNDEEGGIFALLGLLSKPGTLSKRAGGVVLVVAAVGAALLYGDGIITPAISVLSAVEGLELASPSLASYVIPIAVVVLAALFAVQRFGVGGVTWVFGPIMFLWFLAIAALGIGGILRDPTILVAVDPRAAVSLFLAQPLAAFLTLGAVVLCVTGTEALYADLGHFRAKPIRLAWYCLVWPSLLLNYFGQGALLLSDSGAVAQPFYSLVPEPVLYPAIVLSSIAAVIASQAIITGATSLTRQGMALHLLPRVRVKHLSEVFEGRIYLPSVNTLLFAMTILVVLIFRSSGALAGAYGIAVTAVMVTTSVLFGLVMRRLWAWSWWVVIPLLGAFLTVDLTFLGANVFKVFSGGWFPLGVAAGMASVMLTWRAGRRYLKERASADAAPLADFMTDLAERKPLRSEGCGIYFITDPERTPASLAKLFPRLPVLPRQVIFLSVLTSPRARLARNEQVEVRALGNGCWLMIGHHGFFQSPSVPRLLSLAQRLGLELESDRITYYLSRAVIESGGTAPLMGWRKRLFAHLVRNSVPEASSFRLEPDRVVEVGVHVRL